ncbi:MAG: minichromosome maintenance protein MCM [Nanoarchaeota archaeon]|nr:minichromosome maintenance protein MCM [Nanoarchaeota archaeon]
MDVEEQIKKFNEVIETNYHDTLLETVRKGKSFLIIDFTDISKHDPDLAEELLENPDELIKAFELGIEQFDLPSEVKGLKIRIKNLPDSQHILIRNIRSKHIGKLLTIEGIVRQKSDVRPQVTAAKFECPSCGNVISVLQLDQKFKEPSRCGCGRKGKFILLSKELIDAQGIVLEEAPENLEGGEQPKRMNVFLKDDLVSPITEKRTNPGSKIIIVGKVKEIPITLHSGIQSVRYDLLIEANYVEAVNEDFSDIVISEEEKAQILSLASDKKVYEKMINAVAPSIYGHNKVKEAVILQLVGGVRKIRGDGVITRGDMHVLLIGDPGAGKSQILKRAVIVSPKARYVSGKGASGAGLTAAVVKDEFLKGWSLEAGALVLANKGLCCIDEMDKMSVEDRSAMHEALEQQTITISKANIQATLRAETTVLAAANPKFGRFDPYDIIAKQIDLPPALISRFDLIFPIKDLPDRTKDEKLAKHILGLHQKPEGQEPEIETQLLRKFIAYARQRCSPALTDSAIEEIKNFYVEMRNAVSDEAGAKSVPITPRQLEALVRMAEANAKIRLSEKVTKKDAKRSINILNYCLSQVGIDPETGKIDIDRISSGITSSQRNKIFTIKEIILELENKIGKTIPIEDIAKECGEKGISDSDVDEVIEKLKRSGDLFEPRRGFVSRI